MTPDKHFFAAVGVILAAAGMIALTWFGTMGAIMAQRTESNARVDAALASQATTLADEINRQILGLDETLRFLVTAWEANPGHFDLEAWRHQAVVLNGLSRDMVLTDENGIIRQSSVAGVIGKDVSALDYFRTLAETSRHPEPSRRSDALYIGPAMIDGIMRQWHMNVARSMHRLDGSFAGVIDADYLLTAITDVFSHTDLGSSVFAAVVGLSDQRLRGAVGPTAIDPDAGVAGSPMSAAVAAANSGLWTGPSAGDAVTRIHAFQHIPGRDLAVIVAVGEHEAMRGASLWRQQAQLFATCITVLLLAMALILIRGMQQARRRDIRAARDRAVLAASNMQLEAARAFAAAKAEQFEATLAGMTDGVSTVDGDLRLVEWNARFPEIAGVPAEILRVGLPMEDILRAQAMNGQFGWLQDPEVEVQRRIGRLRVAPFGVTQRQRPDGHTIELRRNRLPDGGFVTLYADITEHKRAEDALRAAQAAAEMANAEKSRFVAMVSHEIRTPLNALLNTVRLLADSVLTPAQRSLLMTAHRSGEMLFSLVGDILVMSEMEAGTLTMRPSLFELRPLLESCVELFATQAAERGMIFRIAIAAGTPDVLLTDPGRLRQVELNLLSNAIKYARPGEVWLTAEPGRYPHEAVYLTVKDDGPVINPEARRRLFRPFSRLQRLGGDDQAGSGLGLSICRQLMALMDGTIGCDTWATDDGREGNVFWMTLPATALPLRPVLRTDAAPGLRPPPRAGINVAMIHRPVPRTRILLAEDVVANQMVTATMLRRQGHQVDIAASGPEVVEAVKRTPYDLIFMDIFMPGMSGLEATQIIRSLPEPARSMPIVALTANAYPEDAEIFRAAGMDGVLDKPVSPVELTDVIRSQVWWPKPAHLTLKTHQVTGPDETVPVLSTARLNELRDNLPADKFAELLHECLAEMDHRMPALRRALTAGRSEAIAAHAHALAGMAASHGMAALEVRLRTVMNAARGVGTTVLDLSFIQRLDTDFQEAAVQLRKWL